VDNDALRNPATGYSQTLAARPKKYFTIGQKRTIDLNLFQISLPDDIEKNDT